MSIQQKDTIKKILMMAILGLSYLFSNFHRNAFGVLSGVISAEMGLTSMQIRTLASAIFYSYAIMQVPCGIISDKISTRKLITFSCLTTAASTILFASTSNFSLMIAARILTGASTALVYVPALVVIRKEFGDETFGAMTGIMVSMGQVGSLVASVPLKLLNDLIGWRRTFISIGTISIVLALGAWVLILDSRDSNKAINKEQGSWKVVLKPAALSISIWFFIAGGTRLSFQSLWGSNLFINAKGLNANESSILLMCISIGCIFGATVLGKLSDKIGSINTLIISSVIMVFVWFGYSLCPSRNMILLAFLSVILGISGAGGFTVAFTCVKLFSKGGNTGMLTGINNCFAFMGSALFTQFGVYLTYPIHSSSITTENLLMLIFATLCILPSLSVFITNKHKA